MQGSTSREACPFLAALISGTSIFPTPHLWLAVLTSTCSVTITSEAFRSKMQPARHRMVYALLKDEMAAAGGIHALQLRTRTPEEEERQDAKG
ncbi:hypothetical protein W97_01675 [Coniosporium apollinis CBS 100218]|uniref:BolA protein n=1 Tax=Coniosporium apollinis (strain CBS 100218) TaxID=1168221 RepID=R7YKP0_CONA1|nr:uncharacterized protein W97_01675 [Coniosporium apollinis CBS 100218]EON62453.1 hypothetical protein W97_01675 [Coniosporium apollinis CBS 100218]